MPISTMLNFESRRPSSPASTRTCPAISPAVRLRTSPIFPVRQKPHFIAQPTCVEMQNVWLGVSGMKTDSMRRPSSRPSRNFTVPSDGCLSCDDRRGRDAEVLREIGAKRTRQIRHLLEVGHPLGVDPREDLARREIAGVRAPRARPRARRDPSIPDRDGCPPLSCSERWASCLLYLDCHSC